MSTLIYLDGQLVPKEEAKISVFDHCVLYGDGVFEGIRVYSGKVFKLKEHVERLYASARAICLEIPMNLDEMIKVVEDTCHANKIDDGYVRLVVTRGVGDLGLDPRKCPKATVFCIADSITLYPEELYTNGLDLVTVAVPRIPPESLNPQVKSCNYLNNILAKLEAINAGVIEAIMLNHQGYVAECTGDNIFLIKGGILKTPSESDGALKGITRDAVIDLAVEQNIKVEMPHISRYDLYTADECFLTGTAAELIPVVKIDGRVIADGKPGPVTKSLLAEFKKLVRL
ncbi:MAG: branched-chain-amino-acid transaminase [Planctomycetota bacterium]|jgi:branched-chain amino acid aminotransferase